MRSESFACRSLLLLLVATAACENATNSIGPTVGNMSVTENSNNALSLIVSAPASGADSARVTYWESGGTLFSTPYYPVQTPGVQIPVLGLKPLTGYNLLIEARGSAGRAVSTIEQGHTGSLPASLQRVKVAVSGTASSGYTLFALWILGTAIAVDSTGRIVWYREFPLGTNQRIDDAELQPNGHYTSYLGTTAGWQPDSGTFLEYAPDGTIVRNWAVPRPMYTDEHDFLLTDDGMRAHFFTYDIRQVDLSAYGGSPTATVAGHSIVRMQTNGTIEYNWNAWDRIPISAWAPAGNGSDFDHLNSLALDQDGNYIVSVRNLDQIRKINSSTGEAIWTLGRNGQYTFVNDPMGGFSLQHSARMLPDGHLLIYDNGTTHSVQESRAAEYALDHQAHTATLVWEYHHSPAIYTPIMGYVQRLSNGNTVVSFSQAGVINEVSPAGQRLWEGVVMLDGVQVNTAFYRARRIASLYQYFPD
jgi:hypothetical protein